MAKSILLVEQNDDFRHLIGIFLTNYYVVVGAKTGIEAMYLLQQGNIPDAVIINASLFEFGDTNFVSNLKSSGAFSDIPVIVIGNASGSETEESLFLKLGVSVYIKRPFNPLDLKARLENNWHRQVANLH